jgi:hypothetical protein
MSKYILLDLESPKVTMFFGTKAPKYVSGRNQSCSCLEWQTQATAQPPHSPLSVYPSGPGLHELLLQKHPGLEHWQCVPGLYGGQLQPPPDVPPVLQ